MNLEKYPVVSSNNHRTYTFFSEGPRGQIEKKVNYRRLQLMGDNIFNLGFGDWEDEKQKVNDLSISNNGDAEKILATVAATVIDFLKQNPRSMVHAKGSTASRTRLYQMKIATYWPEISKILEIYGRVTTEWFPFEKDSNYEAFLAGLK